MYAIVQIHKDYDTGRLNSCIRGVCQTFDECREKMDNVVETERESVMKSPYANETWFEIPIEEPDYVKLVLYGETEILLQIHQI